MTIESAFFIEPKIVFGEIQPLLENKFSLFQIHRKKPYPLLNVMLEINSKSVKPGKLESEHSKDSVTFVLSLTVLSKLYYNSLIWVRIQR
jgi:hypothetical protein